MKEKECELSIRPAVPEDSKEILGLIRALAAYEKMEDQCVATEKALRHSLSDGSGISVLLAESRGKPVGYALYFHSFSTFLGKPGIYLEDLFVRPEMRGRGIGKAMFRRLAKTAKSEGCGRLEWACLDWNLPSIRFYRGIGARPLQEWTTYRLEGSDLAKLQGKTETKPLC